MKSKRSLWLLFLILPSLVHADHADDRNVAVVTPSQLNANASFYDGKEVFVRGFPIIDFERREFYDNKKASKADASFKNCVTLVNAGLIKKDGKFNKKMITVHGIFMKNMAEKYVQLGGCNLTAIDLENEPEPILVNTHDR